MSDDNNNAQPIPPITDNAGLDNGEHEYEVGYGKPPRSSRLQAWSTW